MLPHISIKAEKIFELYGIPVTNSMLLSALVFVLFIVLIIIYNFESQSENKSKFFYFMNFVLRGVYGLFESIFGPETKRFFPLVGALFFYILLQNWFGLLPGVGSLLARIQEHGEENLVPLFRGNSADLNSTIALALIAVFMVQYYGVKELGVKGYLSKFINFANPIAFIVGILEVVSELSRIISFAFRLFGNIFAGEVLIAVIAFLIPILVSFPFLVFEVFIGLIQALVFSLLSAVLFKLAMAKGPH